MPLDLSPANALIFRIVHLDNLPWIFDHGLCATGSGLIDPNFRAIGNPDLIGKRTRRSVPVAPGGTLSDYVPFYFTPYSIMMFNIKTGYGGITRVPNEEIVIFVSSLHRIATISIPFVFTNQHAYPVTAEYFTELSDLNRIDWALLRNRDFKTDSEDPGKKERYQAGALVWRNVPLHGLAGVTCYSQPVESRVRAEIDRRGLALKTGVRPEWYF